MTMTTIRTLIDGHAAERGNDVFLIAPEIEAEVTWTELRDQARELGARFEAMGIDRGEKVAVLLDNGRATTVLFLAIMYAGRVVVPLNAVSGDSQLEYVLDHCDARLLFASETYAKRMAPAIGRIDRDVRVVLTSQDDGPDWSGFDAPGSTSESPAPEPEDDALLIYTSGTTGRPKGVLHTHSSVIAGARNTVLAHALSREDRALCVLPLYHINAEIVTVVAPLLSGGSVVMPHRFSARAFWDLVARYRCTWFSVVPTIIAYLLEPAETTGPKVRGQPEFAQLRFGRSASSALPPSSHRAFEQAFGVVLVETMGLSETAAQILSNPLPPFETKYGSPGIPYGNEARVVGEDGRTLAAGEIGEILIRGDNVMKEYYKNPEATAKELTADGWLHTGDLGYCDEDGFFFITGRLKELIIKGGENIAPREIDDILFRHPAVLEAAAFGVPDDSYGQDVMACVVAKEGVDCSPRELREFCIEHLGPFKAPREVCMVRWLPKGPSGKVQRLKIADMLDELGAE
jgi:acyl-CoA synthetase (AMP-forming)/AMP-acid ligase II